MDVKAIVWRSAQWNPFLNATYYIAKSSSGQDEANPPFWLATREGKLGISREDPAWKNSLLGHLINPLLTKLIRPRRLDILLSLFCVFVDLDFVSVHKNAKKKNSNNKANIHPSWPHLENSAYMLAATSDDGSIRNWLPASQTTVTTISCMLSPGRSLIDNCLLYLYLFW